MRRARLTGIVLVLGIAIAILMTSDCAAESKKQTATESTGKSGFEVLTGRWLRPDGGYIIQIQSIEAGGKMVAGYFNPRPINVSKAQATKESGRIKVFVELSDVGYPGSTYTLTYDPKEEVLRGVYYQAAAKQSFDVYFTRMK
jgi:hypothetical protein